MCKIIEIKTDLQIIRIIIILFIYHKQQSKPVFDIKLL